MAIPGERIRLRAVEWDDVPTLHQWLNTPAVMRGWGVPDQIISESEVRRRVDGYLAQEATLGWPVCLIAELDQDHDQDAVLPIGVVIWGQHDLVARSVEVSLAVGDEARWSQGYGADILETVLTLAFAGWNLHRVWLRAEVANVRAHRLYRRSGFQREGTLRAASYFDGRYHDLAIYSLLAQEWFQHHGQSVTPPVATTLALDPNELFDVVTAEGQPTGEQKARAAVHRDGDWHRAVHVWVVGIDAAVGPYLVFQRRGHDKDTWPGVLDATVGGHYRAGETLVETLRETEEEIGVTVQMDQLVRLGTRAAAYEVPDADICDHELQDVFLLRDDRPLTAFQPNADELAALVRVPLADVAALLAGERAEVRGESLTPGATTIEPLMITPADFIPTVDNYFYRVTLAVGAVLGGESRVAV